MITGHAYGRRATLSVAGDTLTWRAQRGARRLAENIATTVHDVRRARWIDLAWSRGGGALVAIGALWAPTENLAAGLAAAGAGLALLVWRRLRPRHVLLLDVGDRRLTLQVARVSAPTARALAGRIERALSSGEPAHGVPRLP